MGNLIDLRDNVKGQIEAAKGNGHIPAPAVTKWLQEFEDVKNDVISIGTSVKKVEHIPGPTIEGQTTASRNLMKVLNLLNDDSVNRIGVWGMGGVGKTTLVKNLNNKLETATSTEPFSIIIWATVSKDWDLKRVQTQLLERLNLAVKAGESMESTASRLHRRLEKERFLLILDDVWEAIDLDYLGVPQSEPLMRCKIILTSQSLDVCRKITTDKEVKVDVLDEEQSWQLFTQNAGKVASLEHIKPIATEVCKECCGLTLALIIVGASMRGKTAEALWKDALNALQMAVPHTKGIEDKVYRPLKWSYDSLYFQGMDIKSCFLYCSLYPEDFSIGVRELVQCWIAEGLVDKLRNYEDSINRGIALVENLKDSCLLENGFFKDTVKMHDVVRDVSIWIACCSSRDESFVQVGVGLDQMPDIEFSKSVKRVSFMDNRIKWLPNFLIECPKVSSLLLQGNLPLEIVPEGFLLGFPALQVLNLSETGIHTLPLSLLDLQESPGSSPTKIRYGEFNESAAVRSIRNSPLETYRKSGYIPTAMNQEEGTVGSCSFVENASSSEHRGEIEEIVELATSRPALVPCSCIVPNLQIVKLKNLPNLTALSEQPESWQHLEQLEVVNYNRIKKLPFTTQNANTMKEIRGELQWWDQLEWDDEDTKSSLQQYFIPL
ncbi:NB-ARC domain-containing disease resistance protein [Actinidia rufa]|uniref:NB-ARC domain-containing disease resistance protein n=1 Tax=Actinidia rufa TaxID=165716 RepID=A0A7J0G731_9ERIC|nr:NB-ARC domain-containing disease resistance protein [Actinidia rufa]